MVNVHIITILYMCIYIYIHIFIGIHIHIWQAWSSAPGEDRIVFIGKSTRQFSGQTQTVDIRGLIIIVSLFIIINNKRTIQDITSQTFKVVSNSGMLVLLLFHGSSGTSTHNIKHVLIMNANKFKK